MPYVHAAAALLGYWLGYRTIPRFLRWRLTRAARRWERREYLHEVSSARYEVEAWAEQHLNVLERASACRSCWNEAPPGVQSAKAAPSMYDLCREHKKVAVDRHLGTIPPFQSSPAKQVYSTPMTSPRQYSEKELREMDYEEYLKYVRGFPSKYAISGRKDTTSSKNGHLVTGYEDDFDDQWRLRQ